MLLIECDYIEVMLYGYIAMYVVCAYKLLPW